MFQISANFVLLNNTVYFADHAKGLGKIEGESFCFANDLGKVRMFVKT